LFPNSRNIARHGKKKKKKGVNKRACKGKQDKMKSDRESERNKKEKKNE
jgi:hypothetical protein